MERKICLLIILATAVVVGAEEVKSKRQISALPTIENCKKLRQECLKSCKDVIFNCSQKCPVCPIVTKVDPVPVSSGVINRNVVIDGTNGTSQRYSYSYPGTTNHTTVIKLSNFINNTNLVNVPTHVNSTNVNNIHIYANNSETGGAFGLGQSEAGSCCFVVQPKTCRFGPDGVRCHHQRHKTCGPQCTSRIVHSQVRRGEVNYIPQPQPSCFYTPYWPFVNCAPPQYRDCSGCYEWYNVYSCAGCYNEGLDFGQLYRRGPVMRPPPVMYPESEFEGLFDDFKISSDTVVEDDEEAINATAADWGVVLKLCKVISSNETVQIENCTEVEKENPYAASPVNRVNRSIYRMQAPPPPPPMPMAYYNPAIEYYPERPVRMRRPKEHHIKRRPRKTNKKRQRKVIVDDYAQ